MDNKNPRPADVSRTPSSSRRKLHVGDTLQRIGKKAWIRHILAAAGTCLSDTLKCIRGIPLACPSQNAVGRSRETAWVRLIHPDDDRIGRPSAGNKISNSWRGSSDL